MPLLSLTARLRRTALAGLAKSSLFVMAATDPLAWPGLGQGVASPMQARRIHGFWVWNTKDVIGSPAELGRLIEEMQRTHATEAYFYLDAADYVAWSSKLAEAITTLSGKGMHAWGLEGSRVYFSDADGPAGLYAAAEAMLAFNARHPDTARFRGFVADLEPQDGQGSAFPKHFHNDLPGTRLSRRQATERQALLLDWLDIHGRLSRTLRAAGLPYAAAMPVWTDDYYGEPIRLHVGGRSQEIQPLLMALIDLYLVMSYSTKPDRSIRQLDRKLDAAARLGTRAPMVHAVLETHRGPGRGISYGDDPVKAFRHAVLADVEVICRALAGHARFGGVDLHDWSGWSKLRP